MGIFNEIDQQNQGENESKVVETRPDGRYSNVIESDLITT